MKQFAKPHRLTSLLLALCLLLSVMSLNAAAVSADEADDLPVFATAEEAGGYVREQMTQRNNTLRFRYADASGASVSDIMAIAFAHTGTGNEGDYLRWQQQKYSAAFEWESGEQLVTITVTYYTTAEQEEALAAEIDRVLGSLDLSEKDDYHKVKAIYDYITQNVNYYVSDGEDKLHFSAYSALLEKRANCQGYASLFYRMALQAGLDCRFIKGDSIDRNGNKLGHGWNIICLDGTYYYLDAAWDSFNTASNYQHFLRGTVSFMKNHEQSTDYPEYADYEIPTEDYTCPPETPADIPTNVIAERNGYNSVKVSWELPEGAVGARVYRATAEDGPYTACGIFETVSSGTVGKLEMGDTYYFKVAAVYAGERVSGCSSAVSARPYPLSPYNTKTTATGTDALRVSWGIYKPVEKVEIWQSEKANAAADGYTLIGTYDAKDYKAVVDKLIPNKTYYFKLRGYALNSNGDKVYSDFSEMFSGTTKAIAAPGSVKVSGVTPTSIQISWKAPAGANYVEIRRAAKANAAAGDYTLIGTFDAAAGSATVKVPTAGKLYYYQLRGVCADGSTVLSAGTYSTAVSGRTKLNAPTGVKAKTTGTSTVRVQWSKTTGAVYYEVYRMTKKTGAGTLVGTYGKDTTACTVRNLKGGSLYYFKVRAFCKPDGANVYSPYSTVVSAVTKLAAPTGVTAKATGKSTIKIKWNKVEGAEAYQVYRMNSKNGKATLIATCNKTTKYCISSKLKANKKYYYKVRAVSKPDGTKRYSSYSQTVSATTKKK